MPRIPKEVTTIRLTKAHRALLDQAGQITGKTPSEIIRDAINQYFALPAYNPLDEATVKKIVEKSLREVKAQ